MSAIGPGSRADRPLVVLGPTASGKSTLALEVAGLAGAEIISVDSMQVYRGMDIGTASPSPEDRAAVRHHLVDLVDPPTEFTVGEFQRLARAALADIRGRGGVSVLVGGTGLYLRAVVDDLDIPGRFPEVRAALDADPDTAGLHRRLRQRPPVIAVSAHSGRGLGRLLDHVEELYAKHVSRISTPSLNRALAELREARPGPQERGRRLRLLYGTQTGVRPPRLRVYVNEPRLVTRDYGYWVENELRRRFTLEGVPVSIDFRKSE